MGIKEEGNNKDENNENKIIRNVINEILENVMSNVAATESPTISAQNDGTETVEKKGQKIVEEKKEEIDESELQRIERVNKLSALSVSAKNESSDLRCHHYHLLKKVVDVLHKNNNCLGLGVEVPSSMNLLSASSSNTKQNEFYENILKEVEYLHTEYGSKQKQYNDKIIHLNDRVVESDENAINLKNTYKNFKRKICRNMNKKSKQSTKIETKWILQKEEEEQDIDNELEQERLKNIHFNMNLKKLTLKIKEKDKLSDGLHLIDFEQLKIENQTLNEKIEERNDELYKLKKKITNTVQILTHCKEKLQFIKKINQNKQEILIKLEETVNAKRDKLNELKKKRDSLRSKNTKLKQKQGFIANDVLVIDFQETKNALKANQQKLTQYKRRYETLQKTIDFAKTLQKNMAE